MGCWFMNDGDDSEVKRETLTRVNEKWFGRALDDKQHVQFVHRRRQASSSFRFVSPLSGPITDHYDSEKPSVLSFMSRAHLDSLSTHICVPIAH